MFSTNLCDEVSKTKNLICTFSLFFHADRHEIFFVCNILPFLMENWPRKWAIFIFFIISWYLKISQYVLHKSGWRNFQNKKIWDVHLLCFSMLILMRYFLFAISYCFWWKIDLENGQFWIFHNFMIFENLPTCLAKISVIKLKKIKNLRCTFS